MKNKKQSFDEGIRWARFASSKELFKLSWWRFHVSTFLINFSAIASNQPGHRQPFRLRWFKSWSLCTLWSRILSHILRFVCSSFTSRFRHRHGNAESPRRDAKSFWVDSNGYVFHRFSISNSCGKSRIRQFDFSVLRRASSKVPKFRLLCRKHKVHEENEPDNLNNKFKVTSRIGSRTKCAICWTSSFWRRATCNNTLQ